MSTYLCKVLRRPFVEYKFYPAKDLYKLIGHIVCDVNDNNFMIMGCGIVDGNYCLKTKEGWVAGLHDGQDWIINNDKVLSWRTGYSGVNSYNLNKIIHSNLVRRLTNVIEI